MGEPEADGEQGEGGDVLGVGEGVGVDARLEGEQGEGEEGGEGGARHAPRQQGAAQRAGEEEEVSGGVAQQVGVAHVVEAQGLPGEQDRQFERRAVEPAIGDRPEVELACAGDIAPIDFGDLALLVVVGSDPVIVEDGGRRRRRGGRRRRGEPKGARPGASSPVLAGEVDLALPQGAPPAAAVGSELAGADAADGVVGERRRDQATIAAAHP